ncbi:hypothetical protein EHO61_16405 [Leptospira fluminis]|uniref:Uncharacterized protein n=1 Tax=Leptospira fluminis TaxID=2484979 RepID=A0A4R9GKA6_9LEPT|nr:hypothetical protein [Leptospira fluminis]TGK14658.1 hypothetical protein EHO61_16405 [Leptospira fluminis]
MNFFGALLVTATILFHQNLVAEPQHSGGDWKQYNLKQILGRLKYYAFAKIAQSVRKGVPFLQEREIFPVSCPSDFPRLADHFNCSFLESGKFEENPAPKENLSRAYSPDLSLPAAVPISAKWYEGSTLAGKGALFVPPKDGDKSELRLFYLNNGKLSHYVSGDTIVVFDWQGSELRTILEVKVDDLLRPLGGREYFFP